jgi:uncharacterized protein (DUF1778 family)
MTSVPRESRREPLNLRWLATDRALIDRAAQARGVTRTDFMLNAARDRAAEVLLDQVYIELDPEAFDAFAAQLDEAPDPSPELLKTMTTQPPWESE